VLRPLLRLSTIPRKNSTAHDWHMAAKNHYTPSMKLRSEAALRCMLGHFRFFPPRIAFLEELLSSHKVGAK